MGIEEIGITDKKYPERLRNIHEPPEKLFVRGALAPEDDIAIAIVGSRKCTAYGKQVAYDLAHELASRGITIISGMALGIDGEAHKGALDAGGKTIAVLGTGVDKQSIYPHTHQSLAEDIIKQGALVSEFEPGTPALPHHFPQRNRIISALSLGVVIVEASEKSGSLITANFALEQGKDVFAVPGPIYSANSIGTNKLIQQGAKLVQNAKDILEELGIERDAPKTVDKNLTDEEMAVLALIAKEPIHTDSIIASCGLPSHTILTVITMLELKEKIARIGANTYAVKI